MNTEYSLPIAYEETRFSLCRCIEPDPELDRFADAHITSMARDLDGAPVFLAASTFDLTYNMDRWPSIRFSEIKAYQAVGG
jgi:peptide chain release factor 3